MATFIGTAGDFMKEITLISRLIPAAKSFEENAG